MNRSEQHELVHALARKAVESVAPEELSFFAATSRAYSRDPAHAVRGGTRTDSVLGSGFDVVVTLVSPVALAVADAVAAARGEVRRIAEERVRTLGLEGETARLLVDSLLESLEHDG